jgi:hypothetical protein
VVWSHSFRVPEGADIVINATVDGRLDLASKPERAAELRSP